MTIDRRDHDRYFLRYQCIKCHGCTSMSTPLKSSIFGDQIRAEFNMDGYHDWRNKKTEENSEIHKWIKPHNYQQTSYYKDYICYLSSEKWKAKREQAFSRDNDICQLCKESPAEQVHHITYERLGDENLEDLLSVCIPCHEEFHKNKRNEHLKKN